MFSEMWRTCLPNLVAQDNGCEFLPLQSPVQRAGLQYFTGVTATFPGAPSGGLHQGPWWGHFCPAPFSPFWAATWCRRWAPKPTMPSGTAPVAWSGGCPQGSWAERHLELESWEELAQGVPYMLPFSRASLARPGPQENFQLRRSPRVGNQNPSEISHGQGCVSSEKGFHQLAWISLLQLSS